MKLSVADITLDDGRAASFIDKTDDDAIFLRDEKTHVLILEVKDFDDARELIETLERSQARKSKEKKISPASPPAQDPPPGPGGGEARAEAPKNEGEAPPPGTGAPGASDKTDTKAKKETAQAEVKPEQKPSTDPLPAKKPKLKCGGASCHDSADGNSEVHNPNDPTCKRNHKET